MTDTEHHRAQRGSSGHIIPVGPVAPGSKASCRMRLHDSFGRAGNEVMHRLRAIQRKAVGA